MSWHSKRRLGAGCVTSSYGNRNRSLSVAAVERCNLVVTLCSSYNAMYGWSLRRLTVLAFCWLFQATCGVFIGCGPAEVHAQTPTLVAAQEAEVQASADFPRTQFAVPSLDQVDDSVVDEDLTPSNRFFAETTPAGAETEPGLLNLINESIFGNRSDLWRPLSLETFFTEGWFEPWRTCPRSTTGAPRQGWINADDGVFYRLAFIDFQYQNNNQQNGNEYLGTLIPFIPISRRFQIRFDVPFIVLNKGGLNNNYHGNFGDFVVSPRFLLSESQDFSQVFECLVTTPTGQTVNGNGQATLTPQYEFWYGGLPGGTVIRGGTGFTMPTNDAGITSFVGGVPTTAPGARTTYNYNLAFGKYWTPHDAGDFATYLSVNGFTTLDALGPAYTFLSVTPGLRIHLGKNYYVLGGIEVPLTGPKNQNFAWAPNFWFTKVW